MATSKRPAAKTPAVRTRARKALLVPEARFRLQIKHGVALGPGKAELLQRIAAAGSIRAAAEEMGMGYRTAWLMVEAMNAQFIGPLVERQRGGAERGGATLTQLGAEVLKLYRAMEQRALKAIDRDIPKLQRLIRD